jgi:ABC-type polysaccharide/polyol phosphate export permease
VAVVAANPLSLAAEALRQYAFVGTPIEPVFLTKILLTSIPFTIVGALAYLGALHRLQIKGKL